MYFIKSDQNFYTINFIFANGFLVSRNSPQLPHLVEHLIMDSQEIREIKSGSAIVNAHTNDVRMTFEMTCLAEDFAKNCELFLRAFERISINNFAKNLEIVKNELKTVSPRRILFENTASEISPKDLVSHEAHIESLEEITEEKAKDFWRDNFAKNQMKIVYSGPKEIEILKTIMIKEGNFSRKNIKISKMESEKSLEIGKNISATTKIFVKKIEIKTLREKVLLDLLLKITVDRFREKLRKDGLIYAIWNSDFMNFSDEYILFEFHFRSQNEKIQGILKNINFREILKEIDKITDEEFINFRKKYELNFRVNQQTETQKINFINSQIFAKYDVNPPEKYIENVHEIDLVELKNFAKKI